MNDEHAEPAMPPLPEPDGNLEIQVAGRWVWVDAYRASTLRDAQRAAFDAGRAAPKAEKPQEKQGEPVAEVQRGGSDQFGRATVLLRWLQGAEALSDGAHLLYAASQADPVPGMAMKPSPAQGEPTC